MTFVSAAFFPSFLAPGLAVAGLAAVSVPILIHILSRRPRQPQPWGAMRFLLAVYRRHRMRNRLEQLLLLALRCLLVALAGLALAGPVADALADRFFGSSGRLYILVLDNGLTSRSIASDGRTRFEHLREAADRLLEGATAADRAALITAGGRGAVVSAPTSQIDRVRRQLAELEAGETASDLAGALQQVRDLTAGSQEAAAGQVVSVHLFSDFSRGAVPLEKPLPANLAELGERAVLRRSEAASSAPNVQVTGFSPHRKLILSGLGAASGQVQWTVTLRRFGEALPAAVSTLQIRTPDRTLLRQAVRWQAGEGEQVLNLITPAEEEGLFAFEAFLEPPGPAEDVLEADDRRHATVWMRRRMVVTILDRSEPGSASPLAPQDWLEAALSPVSDRLGWPLELRRLDPATVEKQVIEDSDAVFLLRPDLVSAADWGELNAWATEGRLLWVTPPAGGVPALWPQRLTDAMGLSWQIGLEPRTSMPPLRLAVPSRTGPEWARLRQEMEFLLKPVQVMQSVTIEPGAETGVDRLLVAEDGSALLVAGDAGAGRLLLSGVAFDPAWTNLPTKPLFVPLLHEVLQGTFDRLQPAGQHRVGERPLLGGAWARGGPLRGPGGQQVLLVPEKTGGGVRPIRPLDKSGLWTSGSQVLTVDVEPQAADTQAVAPQALENWLKVAGNWQSFPLQSETVSSAGSGGRESQDWSLPLLAALLGLAMVEMFAARYVSHASRAERSTGALELRGAAGGGE